MNAALRVRLPWLGSLLGVALAGCSASPEPSSEFRSIEPVCFENEGDIAEDAWVCGETLTVDCHDDALPEQIAVLLDPGACDDAQLAPLDGPFPPGEYDLDVVDEATGDAVCSARLEVTDEVPPDVTTVEIELWPPNHKFHAIELDECFAEVDDCDDRWDARLVWAASDEPSNANGDGNTSDDIVIRSSTGVELRSERQGGSNGRVYTLGFEVQDRSGNVSEGVCIVSVPHDQSGSAAIDDGEAYRIEVDE
ncbi:MAG: hypothetical protein K0V04_44075 [Deltaproteobacteria bacterium]|nr:hypothetical protein [Deltaproteobacteria bacterium]